MVEVTQEPITLDAYDEGLLADYGGGDVGWWQDYIRAALGRAHDFYQSQVTARASTAPDAEPVATYRHVKRGTTYAVIGEAELQCASHDPSEGDELVIYRGQDGKLWARMRDEFHDGRFERIEDTHPAEPVAPAVVEALEWCADDLEAEIRSRWIESDTGLPHPANKHRYDRDMEPVRKARAALAAMGERS